MAVASPVKKYPSVPANIWLRLRDKFFNSPPKGDVNVAYLVSALGLGQKVAENTMPSLKQVRLVGDDNRITDLGERWRDPTTYSDACREIVANVYPDELKDVSPPDNPDLESAQRWFRQNAKVGDARARHLAAFYVMVSKADLQAAVDRAQRRGKTTAGASSAKVKPARPPASTTRGKGVESGSSAGDSNSNQRGGAPMPSLNVAIQIYVDKDMSADQVDHVFASMARHLYGKA